MKRIKEAYSEVKQSFEAAIERRRVDAVIRASGNIIRFSDFAPAHEASSARAGAALGAQATAEVLIHPNHPDYWDIMTDPKNFPDEDHGFGPDGPENAEIIPFDDLKTMHADRQPRRSSVPVGTLPLTSIAYRRIYLKRPMAR